ncbi:hypothetical protein E1A91_A12G236200v1 [Gossypium mustelinum]|uniref:Major facilitator superfamily (MFS) profile domain-containing protein n=1 Tax=Gossypium mustelinum TaxID=34275 RepID=A0A5D2WXV3_GOSMU|nr:hypothetical protein E1A91_A12G236200v1 [Gossypium mustelinum]
MSLPVTQGKILSNAWGYKASRPSGGEACERLTTLGIAINLVTYLTKTMHFGNATATNIVTNFLGTSFMLCLLGGFIADTFLGRYLTIAIFATVQAIDVTILTISTIIPSLSSLGSVTVLVYIQDNLGREWGYDICACAIVIGLVVFLSGTKRYRFKKLVGSPLTQIVAVFVAAWKKRHLELPSDSSLLFEINDTTEGLNNKKNKQKLPHSKERYRWDPMFVQLADKGTDWLTNCRAKDYLHVIASNASSIHYVEEVKLVVRMLPIRAITIIFWTVYAQMTTFFVSQAMTMDPSLTVFFVGSIPLTVPIYDKIIAPIARKVLKNPQGLTPLQRIGVGLILSIIAMIVAALTEIKRLRSASSHGLTNDPSAQIPMSVFWLIPQFFWECPKGMKTMSTGLFLSTLSLGFFVSSVLVTIVHKVTGTKHPWLPNNLNQGRLYDFYWLLAILSCLNLVIYLVFARWYVYKDKRLTDEGIELEEAKATFH